MKNEKTEDVIIMKQVAGDLIEMAKNKEFDVIIHGCNCFNTMGAGIALQIKRNFKAAYEADQQTKKGDKKKLGTYTSAEVDGIIIVNAYTQFRYSAGKVDNINYTAVRQVMQKIKQDFSGKRIGYPMIGGGLAGGDWNIISVIINEELAGEDHTLVKYKK